MRLHWRDREMSPRKWLKAVGTVVGTFVLVYIVIYPLFRSYILAHPRRWTADLNEAEVGTTVERFTFQATDGVELAGWFVPGDGSGATIVSSHGSHVNGPINYPGYAFLHRAGYNMMFLDHRGHGQSGGKATTLGPREVRDLVGAVAYLRTRPDVDPERIGAIGCSMGSAIVIGAAAQDPNIQAVVAESVYADMGELWDRFGRVAIRGTQLGWSWGLPMRWGTWLWTGERIAAFKPEELIGQISPRSVFVIHGELDNAACTVDDARRLYQAAGDPRELWIVPGAGHCGAHALLPEEYETRVLDFFDRALRDGD